VTAKESTEVVLEKEQVNFMLIDVEMFEIHVNELQWPNGFVATELHLLDRGFGRRIGVGTGALRPP
jgi:hypothetical protein